MQKLRIRDLESLQLINIILEKIEATEEHLQFGII